MKACSGGCGRIDEEEMFSHCPTCNMWICIYGCDCKCEPDLESPSRTALRLQMIGQNIRRPLLRLIAVTVDPLLAAVLRVLLAGVRN